jgi:hypothetical protein
MFPKKPSPKQINPLTRDEFAAEELREEGYVLQAAAVE